MKTTASGAGHSLADSPPCRASSGWSRRVCGAFYLDRRGQSLQSLAATQQLQLLGVRGHWLLVH
ncbi:hypothetical protein B7H19_23740 [Pseudomonas putida]|nr:hypothetical protein B7H19_23740 [Pseudomonas putida]